MARQRRRTGDVFQAVAVKEVLKTGAIVADKEHIPIRSLAAADLDPIQAAQSAAAANMSGKYARTG